MEVLEAIKQRYSTKMYDETKKIDPSKIAALKQILHLSPSSINGQPWQFTFVQDPETKAELADASFFNKNSINASDTLVVFSAIDNIAVFEKQIAENLPQGAIDYYNNFVKTQGEVVIKNWFQKQVYLALGMFLSAAATMKIDATPMEGIEADKYDAIINPDGHYTTLFVVTIGYRDTEDWNQPNKKPKQRVAFDKIVRSIIA